MIEHPWIRQYRSRATVASALRKRWVVATVLCLTACGPSVQDSIDKLAAGPDERAMGKHELILTRELAIGPIIAALKSQDRKEVRPDLADVLVSMMLRAEDERIEAALKQHLLDDPDPRVRARIADKLGLHMKSEFFDVFLLAASDTLPLVRTPALNALGNSLTQLTDGQIETLHRLASEGADAEDRDLREAALYVVEEFVARWAKDAREEALKANLSKADSIYGRALAYAPTSKQANFYMGTFYFEYGDRERGLQLLRESHLLFDVPRFASAPQIDGRLDESVWEGAASIDSFYSHSPDSRTSLQPLVQTRALMGYSDEAFYWGMHCSDAHPESLIVLPYDDNPGGNRYQDIVEFFFDRNLDRKTISVMKVNSAGVVRDGLDDYNIRRERDHSWDAEGSAAAYVGSDFWSVEFELRWDREHHPVPAPGEVSGIDFHRLFRAIEWTQPFRGYDDLRATGYVVYQ